MTKIDALSFSYAGDEFLGRSYREMDCQRFVEKCMSKLGLYEDLAGSNAWYRQVMRHGWVGSPEECKRVFGVIPKGALLFILKNDGGEPEKYKADGIGNSSHIGIYTGRGKGAINSSSSRGCVCESAFEGKSIRGGWNRVGLYDRFDYGKSVNWMLEHIGIGEEPAATSGTETKEAVPVRQAVTWSENGGPVNLRARADTGSDRLAKVAVGQTVEVLEDVGEWCRIRWGDLTGWMMAKFLQAVADDSSVPAEPEIGDGYVTIRLTAGEAAAALPVLESICQQILEKAGRG